MFRYTGVGVIAAVTTAEADTIHVYSGESIQAAIGGAIHVAGGSPAMVNGTFRGNSVSATTMVLPEFDACAFGGGIGTEEGDLSRENGTGPFLRSIGREWATSRP